MLDFILLGFLADGSRSGYDLKLQLDNDGAHFWHAHHSQIYTTLRRLERKGLTRSRTQAARGLQERRVYTITAAGRDALEDWRSQSLVPEPAKDLTLARLFFAGPHPERDVLPELRRLRGARRARLARLKARVDVAVGAADPIDLRALTRAHARAVEAADIRWLDQVIARLEALEQQKERRGGRPRRSLKP